MGQTIELISYHNKRWPVFMFLTQDETSIDAWSVLWVVCAMIVRLLHHFRVRSETLLVNLHGDGNCGLTSRLCSMLTNISE